MRRRFGYLSLLILPGPGHYVFTYAINGVSQAPVSTSSDPYTLNATLAGTYTIVNVSDATGCTNIGFGSALVTYYLRPPENYQRRSNLCGGASTILTIDLYRNTTIYIYLYRRNIQSHCSELPSSVYKFRLPCSNFNIYTCFPYRREQLHRQLIRFSSRQCQYILLFLLLPGPTLPATMTIQVL